MTKKKQKRKDSGSKISIILILLILGYFLTPLPRYALSLIPESWIQDWLSSHYQTIVLHEGVDTIDAPRKFHSSTPLPVFGLESGICFYFHSTTQNENRALLKSEHMDIARRTGVIAEIIAIDLNKKEYNLDVGEFLEFEYETDKPYSIICQKFNRQYSLPPEQIDAIYVRPFLPFFTPYKVTWETIKSVR